MVARSTQTFLFADLAGYSALTEAHGDETAADLAADFCQAVTEAAGSEGEMVKTIGDAVMLRYEDTAAAIRLGLQIPHELWTGHGLPAAAVGIHSGPAVERGGDWFGSTVNVAARLAALAAGGEVLVSAVARDAGGEVPGIRYQHLGDKELRNVATPVSVFAVELEERPNRKSVV